MLKRSITLTSTLLLVLPLCFPLPNNFALVSISHLSLCMECPTVSQVARASNRKASSASAAAPRASEPQSDPSLPPMLRYQPHLPSLPVPQLSQTLALYLTTLKPHLTSEEYTKSERIVRDFEGSEQAKVLQSRLEKRATAEGRESWLREWFDEYSYMGYR